MMWNIKAVCAFASLFGLSVFAAERDRLINTSSQNRKTYGKTDQEIKDLRKYLKENLNNQSYKEGEIAAEIRRADARLAEKSENEDSSSSDE